MTNTSCLHYIYLNRGNLEKIWEDKSAKLPKYLTTWNLENIFWAISSPDIKAAFRSDIWCKVGGGVEFGFCSIVPGNTLTGGLLRGDVLPFSPGRLFGSVRWLSGRGQASWRAAALLSLGALPNCLFLQQHSAATDTSYHKTPSGQLTHSSIISPYRG